MRRKNKIYGLLTAVGLVLLLAFTVPTEKYFDIARSLDIFATLFKEVNAFYVDEVDPQKLIKTGIQGMLESLDPYTDYIPEEEQEAFSIQTTGQYAGIGALIGEVNKKTVVRHPYEGFPAFNAGVRVGDEFVSVDGKNVLGKSSAEISALLKGKPKTEVELVMRRAGSREDLQFRIMRDKIKVINVPYQGMINNHVGYIKLDDFTPGAAKEVEAALLKLKAQGAKEIILDLRDNPGGLLHEAVNIVNVFIPKGFEVVQTKGKVQEWNKTYTTLNAPVDTEIPLAILTSGGSASASEIVAGALQDYDRAVLVGQKTFGKGLVQTTRPLSYNAQLKVTTAKYYIPSGRCIQALDYAHRKGDGTVEKFADSLKSEFKTKNGRKVYDGGGLDPDVAVKGEYIGAVTAALISSGLDFEFANKFCADHPEPPATFRNFRLSDADYSKFTAWLRAKNFTYSSDLELQMDHLMSVVKNEKYYDELQTQLSALQSKIEQNHTTDLIRFKDEISRVLESEIAFHYRLNKGQAETALDVDPEIRQALQVVSDAAAYQKMLHPN